MSNSESGAYLKWVALLVLVIQNSGLALTMRYSRIARPASQTYIATTAVFVAEMLKFLISSFLCFGQDCRYDLGRFRELLRFEFVDGRKDFLKLFVPSGLYVIQNNLQYIASSNLPAEIYQVLAQMKIITTALFSLAMLGKKISIIQWSSITALTVGIALVQTSQGDHSKSGIDQNNTLGLICVVLGACTSGFAGVYFEKVLKTTNSSIWLRNIQLSIIGLGFSAVGCIASDLDAIQRDGFFRGYDSLVWTVIFLAAGGGLVVAVVVKYADNILKGFATCASIVLSCVVSAYALQDSTINAMFVLGSVVVCASAFFYSYNPSPPISAVHEQDKRKDTDKVPLLQEPATDKTLD